MSEVTDALRELRDGKRTLDDVAEFFRAREWPTREPPEQGDASQPEPGSFAEVAYAYGAGDITIEQYTVLAKAAADKINRQTAGETTEQEET